MAKDESGELAVITGAGVRIGRRIALELASRGYAIGLHYFRSEGEAQETAEEIHRSGGSAFLLPADLTDPEQINAMFTKIADSPYRLSVLVNSAAEMQAGNLREMDVREWDETLALNLRAPWLCAKAAVPLMQAQGGVIINISDSGARKVWSRFPAYIVSKSALETLTRLLARTLAPEIRVNAIAPGLVEPAADFSVADWEGLVQRVPLRRPVPMEELARAVVYLIESRYITGEVLIVDGGYQLV